MRQKLQLLFAVLAMAISASAENYILYTSSDEHVIELRYADAFLPARIVSNTYEDGQGKIVFSEDVTLIGSGAFRNYTKMTSITIPNSVMRIEPYAFEHCLELSGVTIPNSVTSIGDYAFEGCRQLTSVEIPNSVTSIGDYAFEGCRQLTFVEIQSSVTEMGVGVFSSCPNLREFIGENATEDHRCWIENGELKAFASGEMPDYTLPNTITSIGDYAFTECDLNSVVIPNSVTSIGNSAFEYCYDMTSVTIGSSVASIGEGAFLDCLSLSEIISLSTTPPALQGSTNLTFLNVNRSCRFVVPNSQAVAAYQAAAVWNEFTNIITAENRIIYYTTSDGEVLEVSNYSDFGASIVSNTYADGQGMIVFDGEVTKIGNGAFSMCSNLTSVTLPESVTTIEDNAFYSCSGMTSFYGKFASDDNRCLIVDGTLKVFAPAGLTSYAIPSSVTSIAASAFLECAALASVTLPESVTSIGSYAFSGCYALKEITSLSTTPPSVGSQCFDRVSVSSCVLRVPSASVGAYSTADVWRTFSIEAILESSMAIQDVEACRGTSFTLPIELMNQKTMSGLQFNLTLPEGVTVTGESTTERSEGKIVPAGNMDGNIYRHAARNEGADAIEVGEGAVLKLTLQVDETVELGDYTITLSDIILVAEDREEIKPSDMTATLTIKDYTLGDVNGNGEINVGDAVAIVNYVIKKPQETFIVEAADINDNGEINVGDAVAIVNYVIGKSDVLKAPRRGETADDNSISGFQCEISVTPGASIENISLGEGLAGNMALFWNRTGQYTYAVAALSMNGSSSHVNVDDLLMVTLSGNGTAVTDKLRFFDAAGNEMEVLGGEATGITVTHALPTNDDVYDLAGRKVSPAAASKGIFIKNNKKVILK